MSLAEYLATTTVDALAARAGVGRMTIYRVKAGKPCQLRVLDKISAATGLTREELLPPPAATRKRRRSAVARNS